MSASCIEAGKKKISEFDTRRLQRISEIERTEVMSIVYDIE